MLLSGSVPHAAGEPLERCSQEGETAPSSYVELLKRRLSGSYDIGLPADLSGLACSLYAHSHVVAGKYLFHKSVTYERMELNEHVLVRVLEKPATTEDVDTFVRDLKAAIDRLVTPSHEHMSSAITGVLVVERGISPEVGRKIAKVAYTRHFWLGLRGWSFLRLLGVDLSRGQVHANRRGKEVLKAYAPG